jgi:hypothetical protein
LTQAQYPFLAPPDKIKEIVKYLVASEFQQPVHFAVIGPNGSMMSGFFEETSGGEDMEPHIVVMHLPHGDLIALPVNIAFVDRTGRAALAVIDADGESKILYY